MLKIGLKIKSRRTLFSGYVSLFLPVFIILSAIPVYAVILSHMYYKSTVNAKEIAEVIARSYYNSSTWFYSIQYKACQIDPVNNCSKTNKEWSDISLKMADEIKVKLEDKYKVKVEVEAPKEIEMNKVLLYKFKMTRSLPKEIQFIQKEVNVFYSIQSPLIDIST